MTSTQLVDNRNDFSYQFKQYSVNLIAFKPNIATINMDTQCSMYLYVHLKGIYQKTNRNQMAVSSRWRLIMFVHAIHKFSKHDA